MDKSDYYRKQIQHALVDILEWSRKKREAEQEVAKLRQLVIATANMLPDTERAAFIRQCEDAAAVGFTDSIRRLFRTAFPGGLTPLVIRDKLIQEGMDLSSQSNALASIHSVVQRLFRNEEIERFGAADLGAYRLKQPTPASIKKRLEENLKR